MRNLLTADQTQSADKFTIEHRGISSLDLMDSAAAAFVSAFMSYYVFRDIPISIYCGTGNNGGDGLAIARLLKEQGYDRLSVKIARFNTSSTADFSENLHRLTLTGIPILEIKDCIQPPDEEASILIDGLLGSGLSRPLAGDFELLVQYLNRLNKKIISVDVPTGFPSEGGIDPKSTIIKADLVISFQRPKINFFMPESASSINRFRFVDIGLDEGFIEAQDSRWKLLESDDIREIIKPRQAFSHKGTYGHALIIAGSIETMGAALLCADACLHSGAGLTTACIPIEGLVALNTGMPEVMALTRKEEGALEINFKRYQAFAIGPGLGRKESEAGLLKYVLENIQSSLVLDADALNILAAHRDWITDLPPKTILTPHMKEFDRLFGNHSSCWERIETGRKVAQVNNLVIVLKNQYTFIILPDGNVVINPTGNPAMAVGGMGDVLTGMIVALLAQGYKPEEAAIAASYLHGKAGDLLKEKNGMNSIPARYIISKLPAVIGVYSE